jgi:hypothetical protein
MPTFDSERARLLLRDVESSTRGQMAGLQLELVSEPRPRLQVVGDRLALVRLGVRFADAALAAESRVAVDEHGHLGEAGAGRTVIEIVFTGSPLLHRQRLRRRSPEWWRPFLAGAVVGFLIAAVLYLLPL